MRLLAELVDNNTLVPSKYVNSSVSLPLHLRNLRDWCGGINPLEGWVKPIFGGVLGGPLRIFGGWKHG